MSDQAPTSIEQARDELSPSIVRGIDQRSASIYEFSSYRPRRMLAPPRDHHVVSICLDDSPRVSQKRAGHATDGPALRGEAMIMPAGFESFWDGQVPRHLRIALPDEALRHAAEAHRLATETVLLRNEFKARDPFLLNLTELFRGELARAPHPGQQLVLDALAAALAAHLVREYASAAELRHSCERSGRRAAVARAIDYVAAHPQESISLEQLAAAANLSKYHFARVFREQTGLTPSRYVERHRIELATRLLAETDLSIAEVAMATGFADHSHFTKRFHLHTGSPPSAVRSSHIARSEQPRSNTEQDRESPR